ncbi:hypothetical protein J8273_6002 [Carpediemonas membranifera]|uniref:Reverse transcriptase domain-containing protein n=1 Tax=Carpediemonas membranifera TaxID=201153 RepID=A0A8J6AUA0_9EUKA|nr:hypothetical protein J8273_6002 [Carpediemonas membranifera]|eukprot:KAG9392645.1 hypothetical protein J8273_6002 [Carpediemonas membranifera]
MDLEKGFFQVPLAEGECNRFAFRLGDDVWRFKVLSMGSSTSPEAFTMLTQPVVGLVRALGVSVDHLIDDAAATDTHVAIGAFRLAGFAESARKTRQPAHQVVFRGLEWQADPEQMVRLPADKAECLEARTLLGKLEFAYWAYPMVRVWAAPIRHCLEATEAGHRTRARVHLDEFAKAAAAMIVDAAKANAWRRLAVRPLGLVLATDASDGQLGAIDLGTGMMAQEGADPDEIIAAKEVQAVSMALDRLDVRPGTSVALYIDNTNAYHALRKGFTKSSPVAMRGERGFIGFDPGHKIG